MKALLTSLCLWLLFSPVQADEQELLEILKRIQGNAEATQAAITAGNERALLCKYCHGEDGNSLKDTIPNLASQNVVYLIRQFELFALGKRKNKTMNQIAQLLGPQEKVNIAMFYASQSVSPREPYKPELVEDGKFIFNTKCFFCHGKEAHGKEDTPYIAGQPANYIRLTLSSYNSTLVKRAETAMSRVARALQPDEIEAVTAYLSTLK
jgi:cytochrome c553